MADPNRQLLGKLAKEEGKRFETRLDEAFDYYRARGFAIIEKTPEPMKPIRSMGEGRFVAVYTRKAQPDYKGTIKGGRTVMFEAKYTHTDRIDQSRVGDKQADYLDQASALGARCYVVAGYRSGAVYRIPWEVWRGMKAIFGRKYVTEADLKDYQIQSAWNGSLMLLE